MIQFDLPKEQSSIIKVIGIGGGGNNAVNFMYGQGIEGVDFIICNTDSQALTDSPIPNKIQLGPLLTQGLGAGANPNIGKQATEESFEEIKKILEVNTKMAFITAGMGGGTGTGGAPIIARICRELGILTVGIVTTPFSYEGKRRMQQADEGIGTLKEYVDTLLVISNDKLRMQFGNLPFKAAFAKADNILATAAKCITDVINIHGIVNVDFADVCTAMRNGGVAILGSATAEGEERSQKAIDEALASPLLNDNNIKGAKWILLNITSAEGEHEHTIDEMDVIQAYVQGQAGEECDVILGMGHDNTLEKKLGVTIIATGFKQKPIALQKTKSDPPKEDPKIVMELGKPDEEKKMYNQATLDFPEAEEPFDKMAPTLVDPEAEQEAPAPQAPQPACEQPVFEEPRNEQPTEQPWTLHLKADQPETEQPAAETPGAEEPQPWQAPLQEPPREVFELKMAPQQQPERAREEPAKQEPDAARPGTPPSPETERHPSGGYLARPTHIYVEPIKPDHNRETDRDGGAQQQKKESHIKLVYRDEKTPPPAQRAPETKPAEGHLSGSTQVTLEETEDQKRIAAERIARLRNISFNVKSMENHQELETVPAYIRRDISLDNKQGSAEEPYSGYSVKKPANGKQAEISTINTFLEGKKPD
ncbi:MAG TPA: cell division protein FtsZ [Chitinophagaceae bacterium]|nr:cell division protein FtsZ [Chitinophagaceae bacterium]